MNHSFDDDETTEQVDPSLIIRSMPQQSENHNYMLLHSHIDTVFIILSTVIALFLFCLNNLDPPHILRCHGLLLSAQHDVNHWDQYGEDCYNDDTNNHPKLSIAGHVRILPPRAHQIVIEIFAASAMHSRAGLLSIRPPQAPTTLRVAVRATSNTTNLRPCATIASTPSLASPRAET